MLELCDPGLFCKNTASSNRLKRANTSSFCLQHTSVLHNSGTSDKVQHTVLGLLLIAPCCLIAMNGHLWNCDEVLLESRGLILCLRRYLTEAVFQTEVVLEMNTRSSRYEWSNSNMAAFGRICASYLGRIDMRGMGEPIDLSWRWEPHANLFSWLT